MSPQNWIAYLFKKNLKSFTVLASETKTTAVNFQFPATFVRELGMDGEMYGAVNTSCNVGAPEAHLLPTHP